LALSVISISSVNPRLTTNCPCDVPTSLTESERTNRSRTQHNLSNYGAEERWHHRYDPAPFSFGALAHLYLLGAGPSGLASAKAMIEAGLSPRLFESSESLGGLWSSASTLSRPSMRTNLSKYTCCFSDFAWPTNTPVFPSATMVGEYLAAYASTYLDSGVLSLGCMVTSVQRSDTTEKWIITWSTSGPQQESAEFDHVVIASGFFSAPYIPSIPGLDTFSGISIHSSSYSSPDPFKGKHVAIIGGSLSSVEVAADIAPYAASVHHVLPRPFWVLPKYLPLDPHDPGTNFLPLDLVLYRRCQGAKDNEGSLSLQQIWGRRNEYLRSVCGDLCSISEHLKVDMEAPPYAVVSDMYANFIRSGHVTLHTGRLAAVSPTNNLILSSQSQPLPANITDIIFATGFRPSSASTILPQPLLRSLDFSSTDMFLPFLLHRATLHSSLPNGAFVGHYRGPYFGIIELQARWCADLFSGSLPWPSDDEIKTGIAYEKELRDREPRPQWPRGDYVCFGTDLANTIGLPLPPVSLNPTQNRVSDNDLFVPVHFASSTRSQQLGIQRLPEDETRSPLASLQQTLSASATSALFVAAAVFRSLHGQWRLNRTYTSRIPGFPTGPGVGTAKFRYRRPSVIASSEGSFDGTLNSAVDESTMEYLYSETTEVVTWTGQRLPGTQRYIYRYNEAQDNLELYFAKRDDFASLDYFFHRLEFETHSDGEPWTAKGTHLCNDDTYDVKYTFFFQGAELRRWGTTCEVRGPRKDYRLESWYVRDGG
jgi:cation diffusion facilitator CzcD-associated flavoprotein CzcO